ncbi:MAG TPA: DedA family protein [Balneolales bacterium]|nr:DedA family protein [Balneolales bacterium]
MSPELIHYVTKYGYYAIFVLVFLQESGVPEPIPNEFVLLFSGYMVYKKALDFPLVILAVVLGDFIGTNILYTVFYFFGSYILEHKPKWFPIKDETIKKYTNRVSEGKLWTIYLGRITPFIRGYTSVGAGLLQIKPQKFLPIALISALTWSCAYVLTGYLLGPYWKHVAKNFKYILPAVLVVMIVIGIIKHRMDKSSSPPKNGKDREGREITREAK